jgi:L-ascorbate metabolism protein UlaG (beta-lactamase superfamily)
MEVKTMGEMKLLDHGFGGLLVLAAFWLLISASAVAAAESPEKDRLTGPAGEVEITFLGHGSLTISSGGLVVQVDPYGKVADYAALPKADIVLVTHEHQDHLDQGALQTTRKASTRVFASAAAAAEVAGATVLENGAHASAAGIGIEAVPAYNVKHERSPGVPYHPKGRGNGYVVAIAGLRIYVAGDTENVPEMKNLEKIDIAFLPMNLPYTMTPEMAADAARMIGPKILYPYHFGETDTARLSPLLKDRPEIEIRVRRMR